MLLRTSIALLCNSADTLVKISSNPLGASLSFIGVLLGIVAGHKVIIHALIFCLIFDLIIEWWRSVKCKQFSLESLLERLLSKSLAYFGTLTVVLYIEHTVTFLSDAEMFNGAILTSLICVTELWGMMGSMLAINPNIPGLRLLRKLLKSEIAKKIGISEEELEQTIAHQEKEPQKPQNNE